jgi:NAD(P) transhydrogenase subunit beta
LALVLAVAVTLMRHGLVQAEVVLMAALVGSFAGWLVAMRVTMIQIPAMVAFRHGAGGVAAFLVALVELMWILADAAAIGRISGIIGLIMGAGTFSGSMIASGKLAKKLKQTPVVLPKHNTVLLGTVGWPPRWGRPLSTPQIRATRMFSWRRRIFHMISFLKWKKSTGIFPKQMWRWL